MSTTRTIFIGSGSGGEGDRGGKEEARIVSVYGPHTLTELSTLAALAVLQAEQGTRARRKLDGLFGRWAERYLSDVTANIAEAKWPEEGDESVEPSQLVEDVVVEDVAKSAGRVAQLMAAGYRMARTAKSSRSSNCYTPPPSVSSVGGLVDHWSRFGRAMWINDGVGRSLADDNGTSYEIRHPKETEALYTGFIAVSMEVLIRELEQQGLERLSEDVYENLATIMAMKDVAPGVDAKGMFNKLNENGFFEELVGGGDGTELSQEQSERVDIVRRILRALLENDPYVKDSMPDYMISSKAKKTITEIYERAAAVREKKLRAEIDEQKEALFGRLARWNDKTVWGNVIDLFPVVLPEVDSLSLYGIVKALSDAFDTGVLRAGGFQSKLNMEIASQGLSVDREVKIALMALYLLSEVGVDDDGKELLYRWCDDIGLDGVATAANMAVIATTARGTMSSSIKWDVDGFIKDVTSRPKTGASVQQYHDVLALDGSPVYTIDGPPSDQFIKAVKDFLGGARR